MTRRGFTLVELVLVLAIAAVLAAVAAPRFAGANARYRARLAGDRIAREVEHARQRAVVRGEAQTVTVLTGKIAVTLDQMPDPDGSGEAYCVVLGAGPYNASSIATDFGGGVLSFNGFGVPASAGKIAVTAGGYTCTVTVAATTGLVSVSGP